MDCHKFPLPEQAANSRLEVIFACAIIARLCVALVSFGSNDQAHWSSFATSGSLCTLYAQDSYFNNPPLTWALSRLVLNASTWLGLRFELVFKLPFIAFDIATLYLLVRLRIDRSQASSAVAFAFGLCSILVSSYHGNTDAACIALLVLTAYSLEGGLPPWISGIFFAAALKIKLLPLFLLIPLVLYLRSWKSRLWFTLGVSAGLLPYALAYYSCGYVAFEKVGLYRSLPENWGLIFLLRRAGSYLGLDVYDAIDFYRSFGRWLIIGLVTGLLTVGKFRAAAKPYEVFEVGIGLFLIFAPGFGVQYLAYLAPFLILSNPLVGSLYQWLSGAFMLSVYGHFLASGFPIESKHVGPIPFLFATFGALVGVLIIVWTVRLINEVSRRELS